MTHPFHPLHGLEFRLVTCRQNWGENRAYFLDSDGRLTSISAEWTSLAPTDLFVVVAGGRCLFRFRDLVDLSRLVKGFLEEA